MALRGIQVLEFSGLAPGPFCGQILADFGASVVRVDRAKDDPIMSGHLKLGRGKRSIALDLKHPEAIAICKSLASKVGICIENEAARPVQRLEISCANN